MIRGYRKTISFLLLMMMIWLQLFAVSSAESAQPLNTDEPEIKTPAAILIDAQSGRILYGKNIHQKMYPASITKIMTAILAFESKKDLNSKVTMSRWAANSLEPGSSSIYLSEGEEVNLDQLLHAMLMHSANEAANGIAEFIGGNKENFAQTMTKRAKELGALNTNFVNPNGLHNPNHYTTAYDMAMIAKYAMTIPKFREIVSSNDYVIPPTNKRKDPVKLQNSNRLIKPGDKYFYKDAIGIKTGYTTIAGSTLVSAAKRGDVELIAVVLNSPIEGYDSYMYADSIKLFDYGFENFSYQKLAEKSQFAKLVRVNGSKTQLEAVIEKDFNILAKNDHHYDNITSSIHIDNLSAPIKKGDVVGKVTFEENSMVIGKINLIAKNDVNENIFIGLNMPKVKNFWTMSWFVIKWIITIIVSLFLGLVFLIIIYNRYRITKRRRKKKRMLN